MLRCFIRKRPIADSGFIPGRMGVPSHQFANFFYDDDDVMQTKNIALEKETIVIIQSVRTDLEKAMTQLVPQYNKASHQCRSKTIGHDESAGTGNKCFIGLERRINCPLQLIGLGQSVCTKTTLIGEQFLERIEKTVNVNFIQGAVAMVGDYLMFGVYGNHKQQLVKRRHNICADDSVCAYMQQVLGSAYCSSCCRLFNMSRLFVNLYASIAYINVSSSLSDVANTTETELQTFVIRRDILPNGHASTPTDTSFTMDHIIVPYCLSISSKSNAYHNTLHTHTSICELRYSHDDVLDESWCYSYASFGFFIGSLLLLRRVMESHTLQTADFKMRHGPEPIKYRHRTDMPDITDFTFPKQDWNDIPLKTNARNNPQLASKRDSIQSTNSTNRRGVTNWVRVQVDTDSIRTINASTFGEIGTYSSHIWTMLWS